MLLTATIYFNALNLALRVPSAALCAAAAWNRHPTGAATAAGMLCTLASWVLALIFLGYFIPHVIVAWFYKTKNLKKAYNAEWALVTGASSGGCMGGSAVLALCCCTEALPGLLLAWPRLSFVLIRQHCFGLFGPSTFPGLALVLPPRTAARIPAPHCLAQALASR